MNTAARDELLAAALDGRPDWAAIYLAHRERMFRAAQSVVGTDGEFARGVTPTDVVAEVIHTLQARGLPADVRDLGNYLAGATRNAAKSAWRRAHQTRLDADGGRALREESLGEPGVLDPADTTVNVEGVALDNLLCQAVNGHMHLLTPKEQRAMRDLLRGYRRTETAAEMGITPQRVSQLVKEGSLKVLRAVGYLLDNNDA